jgi:hypothetical protein
MQKQSLEDQKIFIYIYFGCLRPYIFSIHVDKYFRLGHIPEGGVSATFSQGTSGLLPPLLAEIFLFGESNLSSQANINSVYARRNQETKQSRFCINMDILPYSVADPESMNPDQHFK